MKKSNDKKIKIMHLLFSNSFSGAENVVCTIIENYKGNEYEMYYCCPKGPIENILKERKIKYLPLNKWSIFEIRKAIKQNNINIIHAHDFTASIMSILTLFRGKIISHIHCNPDFIKKWNIYSIIYNFGISRFYKVILVSKEALVGTVFKEKLEKKMKVINNVVNPARIVEKSKEYETKKYDILFFGRLIDIKQPQIVIEVTKKLKKDFPNIKTCLVGDGVLMDKCKEMIKEYNLEKNVSLVGFKSNPFPYIKNSKIALMPSKTEGLPMSAIECLILNVPVLNSGKGGLSTLFKDNKEYICGTIDEYYTEAKRILINKEKVSDNKYQNIVSKYTNISDYIDEITSIYK